MHALTKLADVGEWFIQKDSYDQDELMRFGQEGPDGHGPKLPVRSMSLLDRITRIVPADGSGVPCAIAEYDITSKNWFFNDHFVGDPVMPGCLMLDGLWQLTGFYLGWLGARGKGRARGGSIELKREITPQTRLVRYEITVSHSRVNNTRMSTIAADGTVWADGKLAAVGTGLQVIVLPIA